MTALDLYFLGGAAHGRRMLVDARVGHVEVPCVNTPNLWADPLDITLRRDLYRVQRYVIAVEHPCVRNAALVRLHRAAVWDGMPSAAQPPARELVATRCDGEHPGTADPRRLDGDARPAYLAPDAGRPPAWWVMPELLDASWSPTRRWAVEL